MQPPCSVWKHVHLAVCGLLIFYSFCASVSVSFWRRIKEYLKKKLVEFYPLPTAIKTFLICKIMLHQKLKESLMFLCVCATPDNTFQYIKLRYLLTGTAFSTIFVATTISSCVGATRSENFEDSVNATCFSVAALSSLCVMLTGFIFRERTKQLFFKLQRNFEQCNVFYF